MNTLIASGNLGRDYEIAYMPSGKAVGKFPIAIKQGYGEHEKTTWVEVRVVGDRAEKLTFLVKGMKVWVRGSIVLETWEGQNGKGSKLVLILAELDLPPKNNIASDAQEKPQEHVYQRQAQQAPVKPQGVREAAPQKNADFDDNIPF